MPTDPSSTASPPRILTRSTEDLLNQVAWFNRLRLAVAAGMIGLTAVGAHLLHAVVDPVPLYALAGVLLGVDLAYMGWSRTLSKVPPESVRRHVDLQIAIDLLILTAILHYSGGVTNPFVLFYLFHAFIAAMLLSVRAALVVVAVSIGLVAGLAYLERSGWLTHYPLSVGQMDLAWTSGASIAVWLLAFAATLGLSVYFVATVLRQLVKREGELARLDRQLAQSEKLASVGSLAAGVAHEINNPVGVIQNQVTILRYRISDGEPGPVLLKDLDTVEKHVRRIGAITDGLLTFSREAPFALSPLMLNPLVTEVAELVAVPFHNAGVELETRLDHAEPVVSGSPNHLQQVMVNILLNAADASSRGASVTISTEAVVDGAVIRIEDRGEGISAESLTKIFDPFYTTKDVDKGTGLGLAISHGIVERHHGTIDVDSEVGKGTTFRVWLPKTEDEGPTL